MTTFQQFAGSTWVFESTLLDVDKNPITALLDAWIAVWLNPSNEVLSARFADSNVTLVSNVLTVEFSPEETFVLGNRVYYLSIKIQQTDGTVTEFEPCKIEVSKRSTINDNF